MTSPQNPLEKIIKQNGWTNTQAGIVLGCDGSKVSQVLRGSAKSINGKVLDGLIALGYDRDELIRDYTQWRAFQAEQLKAQMITA